jgi:hypothetical protein
MARKRMLDPGIWTNVQVAGLSVLQRLLYIGLISNADDEGRLNGNPTYLKGIIFPHDNITTQTILDAVKRIAKQSLIVHYRVNDIWYIQHPNWNKYQYIKAPRPSLYPKPTVSLPQHYPRPTPVLPPKATTTETKGKEPSKTESSGIESNPEGVNFAKSFPLLLSVGVSKEKATAYAGRVPFSAILSLVRYSRQAKNPAGLIVTALAKQWKIPELSSSTD